MVSKNFLAIFFTAIFLLVNILILPDYGINWDEPVHFMRGQAILHYFLTGKKNYDDLPKPEKYYQKDDTIFFTPVDKEKKEISRRSEYQYPGHAFVYWLEVPGHPPLSDIFASFFNVLFFQKLGLINDVDSYHLYSIFLAALLLGIIFRWVSKIYGRFAGLIASLSLALYPLFLAESHFNIKDVPETVFYSLTIISFYEAVTKRKNLWMLVSAVIFGFALGTKFNILFVPFILISWAIIHLLASKKSLKHYVSLLFSIIAYPIIALFIFFITWPFLWSAPFDQFMKIVAFYKGVGVNPAFGFNTYALQWILYTTPLVILFFSFLGIIYSLKNGFREKNKTSLLILFWFLVPIIRVSLPKMGIYGGVRQIMEYIPAMAILAGIGASHIIQLFNCSIVQLINNETTKQWSHRAIKFLLILAFLPITLKMISIHPNESVYFNGLVGGLKGAREKDIPDWGESLGNPYRQGIKWINKNAEKDAKLAINFGMGSNLPALLIRPDINYSNTHRSVLDRKGEYIIGLTHKTSFDDTYYFKYLDKFLIPLYKVEVDGVSILKVWKNDIAHTKEAYRDYSLLTDNPKVEVADAAIIIDAGKPTRLIKVIFKFGNPNCDQNEEGSMQISIDKERWSAVGENLWWQSPHILPRKIYEDYVYYFTAEKARFIRINSESPDTCFKNIKDIKIYSL